MPQQLWKLLSENHSLYTQAALSLFQHKNRHLVKPFT
ncbi:hypothetical protein SS1G_01977 [Sclerotinia sclerotiorum 1980 UF-70]|uniref:Uncharacterized protein n=1 Tax=Sclerotinia sclerotiorum (strain ATCC 18683 / 1980 / Ss-1) TaxID=665079 RepID=A7E9J7_SCLS1|nr:hypothetical protein SS1G_01977 [Sclerotinia sclerotiorum 1980 UF-70]EDN97049.1 hypothetical protein SS1G_01977 [Sclerotinia sclerotiorum 1980 UF-70]